MVSGRTEEVRRGRGVGRCGTLRRHVRGVRVRPTRFPSLPRPPSRVLQTDSLLSSLSDSSEKPQPQSGEPTTSTHRLTSSTSSTDAFRYDSRKIETPCCFRRICEIEQWYERSILLELRRWNEGRGIESRWSGRGRGIEELSRRLRRGRDERDDGSAVAV